MWGGEARCQSLLRIKGERFFWITGNLNLTLECYFLLQSKPFPIHCLSLPKMPYSQIFYKNLLQRNGTIKIIKHIKPLRVCDGFSAMTLLMLRVSIPTSWDNMKRPTKFGAKFCISTGAEMHRIFMAGQPTPPLTYPPPEIRPCDQGLLTIGFP